MFKPSVFLGLTLSVSTLLSCSEQTEHTAPAVRDRDSVPTMVTYGVNTLVSDSGVIKYRIVAERWEVNMNKNPKQWILDKGVFLEQFDEKFHIQMYFTADTAYNYYEKKLWKFRGHVKLLTKDGLRFFSNELYYNQMKHELYSTMFSKLITPERTLVGSYFRSDDQMKSYNVYNTRGSFERGDFSSPSDTMQSAPDTVKAQARPQAAPAPRTQNIIR